MPNDAPANDRAAGFTLVEMLVVIVILGLMAMLILSHGAPHSRGLSQRAAAETIVETLRLARSRAIAADAPVAVVLDAAAHRLRVDGVAQPALPPELSLAFLPDHGGAFVFSGDGSAVGGSILLGDAQAQARTRITVDWLTGRVAAAHVH